MTLALFVAIAAVTDSLYAWSAATVATAFRRRRGPILAGRFLAAGTYIGLGVVAALAEPRAAR